MFDGLWPGRSDLQEIVPGLHITNFFGARNRAKLRAAGITHVVNCGAELDCCFAAEEAGLCYLHLPLADNPGQQLQPHADGACDFIAAALDGNAGGGGGGGRVLVHCAGGGSRSAAVLLAYLVLRASPGLGLDEALALARSKRPIVEPNVGFLEQLATMEAGRRAVRGAEGGAPAMGAAAGGARACDCEAAAAAAVALSAAPS